MLLSINFNFCFDCTYLSVNRVNAIGEISHLNFDQNSIVRHPFRTTFLSCARAKVDLPQLKNKINLIFHSFQLKVFCV